MRTRILGLAIVVGLLGAMLALSACGGDDDATPATASKTTAASVAAGSGAATSNAQVTAAPTNKPQAGEIDPCALITKAEAEEAVSSPLADGEYTFGQCLYLLAGGNIVVDPFVLIQVDSHMTRELFEEHTHVEGLPEPITIPNLGDVAYEGIGTYVLQGEVFVGITVGTADVDSASETQSRLAALALTRLP